MSMNQLAAANQAQQQAAGQIAGGAGNLLAGGVGMYQDYKGIGGGTDMGGPLADLTKGITDPLTQVYDPNAGNPLLKQGSYTPSIPYP